MTTFLNGDFSYGTLTNAVNSAPVAVGPVSKSELFELNPIGSTSLGLELIDDQISLIQSSLRGGIGDMHPHTNRSMVKLSTSHIRTTATMLADSWLNRIGFAQGGTPANVLQERDRVLREMRSRIDTTMDYMKTRALNGQVLDADGSVIVDLFAEFGQTQQVVECELGTAITNLANKITSARRLAESALGMAYPSDWVIFASAQFIDAVRSHASFETAVAGWSAASALIDDHRAGTIIVSGAKMIEVPNIAGKTFIEAGSAFLAPMGVPGLCVTSFGPADYIESIGELGLPLYAKAEELPMGRGLVIESQSNPISVISRPRAIIKLNA
jgi:hypothetical protein